MILLQLPENATREKNIESFRYRITMDPGFYSSVAASPHPLLAELQAAQGLQLAYQHSNGPVPAEASVGSGQPRPGPDVHDDINRMAEEDVQQVVRSASWKVDRQWPSFYFK